MNLTDLLIDRPVDQVSIYLMNDNSIGSYTNPMSRELLTMEAAFYLYHRYVCCYSNSLPLSLSISSFSKDDSVDRDDIDRSDKDGGDIHGDDIDR